ncbi:conserved unknown protein [Ectocarpus siliculosus]|uniref:RING-type E3 ubiquitin transferase n=1 Tax=Ectocarpus siliculosus TaxID=2880 RepID=D8LBR1_ECTSI|nr:conserved unknown protein [Ectocarpus siliculosus]|eukprot:CBN76770.1 conserved unknown protein [Ectocarpus siliculosus]
MEFEGEDQRTLNELVRTLSGRLDLLIDGDQPPHQRAAGGGGGGGGGASPSAEDAHGPSPSEDEPPECRVCRGEPEPGRRLYAPCLCSGSIMHTHEDCLLEWLQHSGKDTCELCGALFRFTPVYDAGAPQRVPLYQVLTTCGRKVMVKWLPLCLRVLMVAGLWLLFVPVCTSWLYRIWIHRTRVLLPQLFLQRLNMACIWSDCISGIIVTAAIILSFLSLMTFADFLADQLLRDDFGGIGLDGMNLVEAMAEAMDDLRIDNNNNQVHDRVPPPPQEPQQLGPLPGHAPDRRANHGHGGGGVGGVGDVVAPAAAAAAAGRGARAAEPPAGGGRPDNRGVGEAHQGEALAAIEERRPAAPREAESGGGSPAHPADGSARDADDHDRRIGSNSTGGGGGGGGAHGGVKAEGLATEERNIPREGERVSVPELAESAAAAERQNLAQPRFRRNVDPMAYDTDDEEGEEEEAAPGDTFLGLKYRPPTPPRKGGGQGRAAQSRTRRWSGHKDDHNDAAAAAAAAAALRAGANNAEPRVRADGGGGGGGGNGGGDGGVAPPRPPTPPLPPPENAEPAAAGAGAGVGQVPRVPLAADEEEEPEDDLNDEFLDGDMDVHMAIDELLGIRGPVTMLLRNVLWLLAFHGAYLGLFAFFPFSIGASVTHAVSKYLDPHVLSSLGGRSELYLALRDVVQGWYELATSSEEQENTLRLPDLATICLGYMVMSSMVFMWRGIINAISNRTNTQILLRAKKAMRVIAAVVKVGLLLSLKMLLLPLLLGVCLDATTLPLFGCTGEARARFMAQHLVGSLLLHWVLGITFMLFVTVSVLQLREVVHPEVLSLIIRPQEPHPDLLGSLLQESGRTHARRMAMSLAIYLALVLMFVWVPTRLVGTLFPAVMPVQLELRYGMPQLQIPVELVILHLAMLAFLEKYQNRIGEMQHSWLVAVCGRLGLTRFVLPQPIVARLPRPGPPPTTFGFSTFDDADGAGAGSAAAAAAEANGATAAPGSTLRRRSTSSRGLGASGGGGSSTNGADDQGAEQGDGGGGRGWGAAVKAWWDGGEAGKDEEEGIIVGPPLRRPPPGWDDPAGVAQGRWAWGAEPPGEVQLNLAPRRRHGARAVPLVAVLLLAAWATVLVAALCLVVLPFLLGRLLFSLIHLPRRWTHDTASFAVGLTLLKAALLQVEAGLAHGSWAEVSPRGVLWNFAGAVVVRLLAMVLIPTVVSLVAGTWMDAYGADGQFVQLGHFRAALFALTLTRASAYLIQPVRAWLTALHDSVRDDRYLVGMRLQDHSDKSQAGALISREIGLARGRQEGPAS